MIVCDHGFSIKVIKTAVFAFLVHACYDDQGTILRMYKGFFYENNIGNHGCGNWFQIWRWN